ncbi:MAG TPA: 50S ribosomal protein L7/L12 [Candidatus Dependentiae bacterium]|nr:50S ribosomal protein L7/L12 [Candidatus Dependentiae bacterium]
MASKNVEKVLEVIGSMSMLEVADLISGIKEQYGVSDIMPMAAAPAAAAAAAPEQEEKSQYKVTLQDGGAEKVKVIKALRQVVPTLTLTDAKKAVEGAPTVIAEAASKEDAEKMKKALEEAGAKVQLA